MKIYVMAQNGYIYEYIKNNDEYYYDGVVIKFIGKKKEEIYLTATIEGIDLYEPNIIPLDSCLYKEDLIKIKTF